MSRGMTIRGMGVVGGFGCGVAAWEQTVGRGVPPAAQPLPPGAGGLLQASALTADLSPLDTRVDRKALRRTDRFAKLALLGACLALEDAGLTEADRRRLGLIVASGHGAACTTFGFLDSYMAGGDACASPTHFSNSVHNAAAATVSMLLQIRGPCLTVSVFDLSVASALQTAYTWLAEERVEAVLLGAVDDCCPVLEYGRQRGLGTRPGPVPGLSAGEGAVFLVLTRADPGAGTRYGTVREVVLGRTDRPCPELAAAAAVLLPSAWLPRWCELRSGLGVAERPAFALDPLYGDLPVGTAFDLAAAALAVNRPHPDLLAWARARAVGGSAAGTAKATGPTALGCLSLSRDGRRYGAVVLSGGGRSAP